MIISQPISNKLLQQIYEIGISTNEFSTKETVVFWNYNILKNWNNASFSEALLLVKIEKNILQGFLLATVSSKKILIENIFITKEERHKGIASQLITKISSYMPDNEKIDIELLTQAENKNAISAFILNGFIKVSNTIWLSKRNPKESFNKNCLKILLYKNKILNNNFIYKSSISYWKENSNIFIYDIKNNDAQVSIKIFIYPLIQKAVLEFVLFSYTHTKLPEVALLEITLYLFSCNYHIVTFHPQEHEKLLITTAKKLNYIEGKKFTYLRKKIK